MDELNLTNTKVMYSDAAGTNQAVTPNVSGMASIAGEIHKLLSEANSVLADRYLKLTGTLHNVYIEADAPVKDVPGDLAGLLASIRREVGKINSVISSL